MRDLEFEFKKWDCDLEFMVGCLCETLHELGEGEAAGIVPWSSAARVSQSELSSRSIQIYSLAFQLLNMVEENTSNQARRRDDTQGRQRSERGRWKTVLPMLAEKFSADEIVAKMRTVSIEPTLTAHPTESKRATVQEHYRNLYLLQVRLENQMFSSSERVLIRNEIKALLERLLRTGEVYLHRPDIFSELRNVLHYLSNVFPEVISLMVRRFLVAWQREGLPIEAIPLAPVFQGLRFGNWVGGDRDGHPLVTAQVTQQALRALRQAALDLQRREAARLAARLSLSAALHTLPDFFAQRLHALKEICGAQAEDALRRNTDEPWRQYLNLVVLRIPVYAERLEAWHYRKASEYVSDLELLARSLLEIGAIRLAHDDVLPAVQIGHTFGFHLARLDIRQNSSVHDTALGQLYDASRRGGASWRELSEQQRREIIRTELSNPRPFVHRAQSVGVEGDEVRMVCRVLAEHRERFGDEGLGSYIVSMTRSAEDLFTVYLFAREGELAQVTGGKLLCPIPVVPLFETINDLQGSAAILGSFLDQSAIPASLALSGRPQDLMIGYSDSNKDGGIIASFCALQQAQERLVALAQQRNIAIRFFHGRGGTISRGAGPTDRFLASLPHESLAVGIKVTEQGETISQKYANLLTASYNLEMLIAGAVGHVYGDRVSLDGDQQVMDELAQSSRAAYQGLVSTQGFLPFFREATPVDVIEQSKIGSRPSRRSGAATIEDLRAIPWVFAWNQSRFLLSGWFGVGSALVALKDRNSEGWRRLQRAAQLSPALSYLFLNIETSLYSAREEIMRMYASLCSDRENASFFMETIAGEFQRSRALVAELLAGSFAERRPRMSKTLSLREPPLQDLHATQVSLLRSWRANGDPQMLERLLLVTNAIAGGLRTTG
jgi:phosphoenolpyruvate carboxylase